MNIEISAEQLQKQKIMIATPAYGGMMTATYTKSMIELSILLAQYGVPFQVHYLSNESLIPRARNYAADEFMRSDCTHLMFIDADIGFDAKYVLDLLGLSLYDKKYAIITGPYPKKTISWEKIKLAVDKGLADKNPNDLEKYAGDFVINIGKDRLEFRGDEPIEVMEAGTGFMMIPRSTLEAFRDAYPWLSYKPDHARTENFNGSREITAFFDCPIDRGYKFGDLKEIVSRVANGELVKPDEAKNLLDKEDTSSKRYLSEDYAFCQYARDIGLKTWLCPWQHLTHTGTYIWNSNLLDVISIGASPTV